MKPHGRNAPQLPNVPECWTLRGALRESGVSAQQFEAIVRRSKAALGDDWRTEYALPANVLLGRTERLARGMNGVKMFRFVNRFEADHGRKPGVARHIILPQHGYQFSSLRPWVSFTGQPYPADADNETRLEWYKAEYNAGVQLKAKHEPKGLQYLVTEDVDYGDESVIRCPHCCRAVSRCATFAPGASQAEFRALETMERHGLLDYYDLRVSLAQATKDNAVTVAAPRETPTRPLAVRPDAAQTAPSSLTKTAQLVGNALRTGATAGAELIGNGLADATRAAQASTTTPTFPPASTGGRKKSRPGKHGGGRKRDSRGSRSGQRRATPA